MVDAGRGRPAGGGGAGRLKIVGQNDLGAEAGERAGDRGRVEVGSRSS